MNRTLSHLLLLAAASVAYACSTSSSNKGPSGTGTEPAEPAPGEGEPAPGEPAATPPATDPPSTDPPKPTTTDDPTGSPILLGTPRVVRSFAPAGGTGQFVDGPQWAPTRQSLFVSLPLAQSTLGGGGKGVLTTFKADGTNYLEVRAGDAATTGVIGSTIDKDGNLVSAELRVITRTPVTQSGPMGAPVVVATGTAAGPEGPITPFNGPNDVVVRADGSIYVTDPGYNLEPRPANGYLYRIAPGMAYATVADVYADNPSPNGIALTKDQNTLFVSFTAPGEGTLPFIRKYVVAADGSLQNSGKFCELPGGSEPDGIAVDEEGNVVVAMKGGLAVFKSTGEPYGGGGAVPQVKLTSQATNVTFGGTDRKSVYVTTSDGKVLEMKTKVAGLVQ